MFLFLAFWAPTKVQAGGKPADNPDTTQPTDKPPERTDPSVECEKGLEDYETCGITRNIVLLINVLSATLGVVVTAVIIIAGIQYSASAGNPQAAAAARQRIVNAALALLFFAGMYGFLQWIVPGGLL
jgi:hypothetical protein